MYLASAVDVVLDPVRRERRHRPVVRRVADMIRRCLPLAPRFHPLIMSPFTPPPAPLHGKHKEPEKKKKKLTSPARVNLVKVPRVRLALRHGLEHALRHGRPADVAQADEQHGDFLGHGGWLKMCVWGVVFESPVSE